jgi:phage terminase large subunit-like protein
MELIAMLPPEEQAAALEGIDPDALLWDWNVWARPEQLPPEIDDWNVWLILAGRGFGKALDVTTKVLYTDGKSTYFKAIGDLETGDTIFDENGKPTKILQAHEPYMPEKLYELTFSDGTSLTADAPHQWVTWTHADRKAYNRNVGGSKGLPDNWPQWKSTVSRMRLGCRIPVATIDRALELVGAGMSARKTAIELGVNRASLAPHLQAGKNLHSTLSYRREETGVGPKIRDTQEIVDSFTYNDRGDLNHSIPLALPIELPDQILPIDGYMLGVWLGDGSSANGEFCSHIDDYQELEDRLVLRGNRLRSPRERKNQNVVLVTVRDLMVNLRKLGVLDNKHIPEQYLGGSIQQRSDLLAGLLDSDGFIHAESGHVEFVNTNKNLAEGVLFLARSLGQKPVMASGRATLYGKDCGEKFRVTWRPTINPFYMKRKRARYIEPAGQASRNYHRMITSAKEVPSVVVRCLTVDSPNSMYLAGEALIPTHNTRMGAEWVRETAKYTTEGQRRFALVARTAADVRDVIVEGESGIINISPPSEKPHYEPSKRRLTWPNGNTATLFTADEPDGLRGPQFSHAWADEVAAWRQTPDSAGMTAFDNLRVGTRLGKHPKILATTTPKRTALLYKLIEESRTDRATAAKVVVTKGSTMDNAGNLSGAYLETIMGVYEGTSLARQELYGEMLDDLEGAMWTEELVEAARHTNYPASTPLRVIGVDPSVAENPRDECGIVVCASTAEHDLYKRNAWVLEDASIHGSPDTWARKVVEMARKWGCPVVAEVNQGGALVRNAINSIDPSVKVLEVHSKYGKQLRAEPILLAYEQGRVHHVNYLPELESQMYSWIPGEGKSPDRIDAMVHAMTALLIKPPPGFSGGKLRAKSLADRKMGVARPNTGNVGRVFRVR